MNRVYSKYNSTSENSIAYAYVRTSFNNTIITITSTNGDTLSWSSSGVIGAKGCRRSTSYGAQAAAEDAAKKAKDKGVSILKVILKGLGEGRQSSLKGFLAAGLRILYVADNTPVPHNGCRAKKKRRV
uniref:Ribosomal protein S11 n=1 Tax=Jakoba bahamiensis TaxID=221721 RepID=M4Q9X2_9EUKA|nr:ribosomal protein S11 [Jakoba bahamiensis]AGH24166.1 ribosomal protein S11 [Jakoba bahamiensis]